MSYKSARLILFKQLDKIAPDFRKLVLVSHTTLKGMLCLYP